MKERLITGLELGSSKISALISSINQDNKLEIRGAGFSESEGIDRGIVTDLKLFSDSIQRALNMAEEAANLNADNLYVSVSGDFIIYKITTGRISLVSGNGPSEIEQFHIDQVINDAKQDLKKHHGNDKYEILHCIPQYFTIDAQVGISNPVGMIGYALSVSTLIILADIAPMRNIRKAIQMLDFDDVTFVYAPIATSKAVLNTDEKKLGCLMIDFGGGTTDLLIMERNFVRLALTVPKGSQLITHDLSLQLKTPPRFAETLKIELGECLSELVNPETRVNVEGIGGREHTVVHLNFISQIIEARVREIFEEAYKHYIQNYPQAEDLLIAGIVLTGGGALSKNADILCSKIFNMAIRIGTPEFHLISGPVSRIDLPNHATIIGLLYYAYEAESISSIKNFNLKNNISSLFKPLVKLFKDFS